MAIEEHTPQGVVASPALLAGLIRNPAIPKLYMQSFFNFASPFDISVAVLNSGVPTGVITMTYGAARSLIVALEELAANYERAMGTKVLTAVEANEKMTAKPHK